MNILMAILLTTLLCVLPNIQVLSSRQNSEQNERPNALGQQRFLIQHAPRSLPVSFGPLRTGHRGGPAMTVGTWTELGPEPYLGLNPRVNQDCQCPKPQGTEPMSGQVSAIAVDLSHDHSGNLVYVGSSSGGLWKSTNGLSSDPKFVHLSDQSESLSVGAIALNTRTNPTTIYVGTGAPDNSSNVSSYTGDGILISDSGGRTWKRVAAADKGGHPFAGLGFSSILIDPANPRIMLASTGIGTDPNHPHSSIPQGSAAFQNLGIYRSTDAGDTWTRVMSGDYGTQPAGHSCCNTPTELFPSGFFHIELLYEPKEGAYIAGVTGRGLFKSTDRGATWKPFQKLGLGAGLPAGDQMFRISLATRKGILWALVLTQPFSTTDAFGLFQSDDQGRHWRKATVPSRSGGIFKGGLMYVAAPPESDTILVATDWIYRTNNIDDSKSWSLIEHNIHGDQHAIAFANASAWYVGDDGGAWSTTNRGDNWTSLSAEIRTLEFFSADGFLLPLQFDIAGSYAGGMQDNGPGVTPGGPLWAQATSGDGGYVAADPTEFGHFFVSTQYGDIYYASNQGILATVAAFSNNKNVQENFLAPFELLPNDPRLYAGSSGAGRQIFEHSRFLLFGAANPWLIAFDPDKPSETRRVKLTAEVNNVIFYIAQVPGDPTTAYVVAGSNVYKIGDISVAGRAKVTRIPLGPLRGQVLGHLAVATAGGRHTLYVIEAGSVEGQKIFKSENDGTGWTNISGTLPNVPMNWITVDPASPDHTYVAGNTGVYVAADGGVEHERWERLGSGLPDVPVMQTKIISEWRTPKGRQPRRALLAATYGRNVWIMDLPAEKKGPR